MCFEEDYRRSSKKLIQKNIYFDSELRGPNPYCRYSGVFFGLEGVPWGALDLAYVCGRSGFLRAPNLADRIKTEVEKLEKYKETFSPLECPKIPNPKNSLCQFEEGNPRVKRPLWAEGKNPTTWKTPGRAIWGRSS